MTAITKKALTGAIGYEILSARNFAIDLQLRVTGARYEDTLRDDDLPGEPGEPRHSYLGLMAENARIMAENLGGDPSLIADFDPSNVPGVDAAVKQAQ